MASLLYKDHLIVSSATFDNATKTWFPSILISWRTEHRRESHALDSFTKGFDSSQEAEELGIEVAKAWIDNRL